MIVFERCIISLNTSYLKLPPIVSRGRAGAGAAGAAPLHRQLGDKMASK